MPHRRLVLVAALLTLTVGCLGGEAGLDTPDIGGDDPEPSDADGDGSDANRTDESDEEDAEDGDGDASEEDGDEEEAGDAQEDEEDEDAGSSAGSHPPWPDAEEASIRPGAQISAGGQCTSNFLFRTPDNATLMLGVAAHCVADAPSVGANGCADEVDPMAPGAGVDIEGASQPGELVYSSWYTMHQANVTEDAICRNNDFALVAIDPADRTDVHPAVRSFGGPTELAAGDAVAVGDSVQWYGNTGATPSGEATSRHEGTVVSSSPWRFQAYSSAPGLPGDSGSGVMLEDGSAAGLLVTLNTFYPGANSMTKLDPALSFAEDHGVDVELVTWRLLDSGPVG